MELRKMTNVKDFRKVKEVIHLVKEHGFIIEPNEFMSRLTLRLDSDHKNWREWGLIENNRLGEVETIEEARAFISGFLTCTDLQNIARVIQNKNKN